VSEKPDNPPPARQPNDKAPEPSAQSILLDLEHKGSGKQKEIGGRKGPDPTRFGDWEKNGRCIDF
jgi:hypothetical protein